MDEWIPEPEERGWREPPRRRPPTAIGVATPPPPRGPDVTPYYRTRVQRIGRAFALASVSASLGIAAGTFVWMPILVASLAVLVGGRLILQRQASRFSRTVLYMGSNASRQAA